MREDSKKSGFLFEQVEQLGFEVVHLVLYTDIQECCKVEKEQEREITVLSNLQNLITDS